MDLYYRFENAYHKAKKFEISEEVEKSTDVTEIVHIVVTNLELVGTSV